jgi:hypothetical protein
MTNDEIKMTKGIRMTNGASACFDAVHQTRIGIERGAGCFLGHLEFVIPSSLVIGHWSFRWLKA